MNNVAFTFGDSKEASLYFDHIIPLGLIFDSLVEYGWEDFFKSFDHNRNEHWRALLEVRKKFDLLMPPELNSEQWIVDLGDVNMNVLLSQMEPSESTLPEVILAVQQAKQDEGKSLASFIARAGIVEPSFTANYRFFKNLTSAADDVQITIANLNLIDTSKATMDQILSFREDAEARTKLRKLRLFAKQNYFGKSRAYVEDDLQARIYDYEKAVERWGFETKRTAISMVLKSKTIAAAVGGSLIGAVIGEPAISIASLGFGTLAEFANVALEVSRVKVEAEAALLGNPVSYIHQATEALSSK